MHTVCKYSIGELDSCAQMLSHIAYHHLKRALKTPPRPPASRVDFDDTAEKLRNKLLRRFAVSEPISNKDGF